MQRFLASNRDELIARCTAKVAQRSSRAATRAQLANGVPLFLDQLIKTLEAEDEGNAADSQKISGASRAGSAARSEMAISAAAHGRQLLALGYSVDQVVHDYGDLCQAITDLAVERDAPFAVDQFRTLNRCLDNAIADAVTAFSLQRDAAVVLNHAEASNARVGLLVHELRNSLHSSTLALTALEAGSLPVGGSTGAVLKRGLLAMGALLTRAVEEVRVNVAPPAPREVFSVPAFVAEAESVALLHAAARNCSLIVQPGDPLLKACGNRELLMAALVNLLHNAFKFTRANTSITLSVRATEAQVCLDVEDHCGGLPAGSLEVMFIPFTQRNEDRTGLGLGLSIARRSVEADGGTLAARDLPGQGCVFTMSIPRDTTP
jgi:signal transduction histidine kinase